MVRLQLPGSLGQPLPGGHVSIPLWFDCNSGASSEAPEAGESPSHYGSTATVDEVLENVKVLVVSIPLWFDCNSPDGEASFFSFKSPSHYGSTATLETSIAKIEIMMSSSPSHYGSTATT